MANVANVRFYRLEVLPSFDVNKHIGIFVHVTGTMHRNPWTLSDGKIEKDPSTIFMTSEKAVGGKIDLVEWLTRRQIEDIASGLWFGGENGWELLSNETNSGAINDAIDAKINALDAGPYAQAEITTATDSSTLTIKGIQEVDGLIGAADGSDNVDFDIAIDGVYNESTNKIATKSTIDNKIGTLNSEGTIQAVTKTTETNGNTTLTFNGIKEENGVIVQGTSVGADTFIVGDAKLKIQIGSATIENVFSANAQSDGDIKLNEYVFRKDENNVISVITPTAVSESNKLVTQQDIANLAGAMYYKGSIASDTNWPANENVKAGYVWIASGNFEHGAKTIESGDLIVFNTDNVNSDYTVVQSNITLGIGDEQIAKNDGALVDGKLVVATQNGIKTTSISASVLEDANNTRNLTYSNVAGGISIKDAFTVIGKDFTETINISSTNRSIKIARNAGENDSTGVVVDLVWNTIME